MKKDKLLTVLENKEFLKLWMGHIFSSLGDAMIQISLMALAISLTPKAGPEMAKILFFFLLPSFILGSPAGALSDRFSRKWMMILSNAYRAGIVLIIPFFIFQNSLNAHLGLIKIIIYSLSFLVGVGSTFFYPAKQSSIPNLVKSNHLQFANALNAGTAMIAILLGTVISGSYISHFGLKSIFFINTFIYILAGIAITFKSDKIPLVFV